MKSPISRGVSCDICGRNEFTRQALLPDGWMITWETSATLCDECIITWKQRFGSEPEYYIRGGEDEYGTIS